MHIGASGFAGSGSPEDRQSTHARRARGVSLSELRGDPASGVG